MDDDDFSSGNANECAAATGMEHPPALCMMGPDTKQPTNLRVPPPLVVSNDWKSACAPAACFEATTRFCKQRRMSRRRRCRPVPRHRSQQRCMFQRQRRRPGKAAAAFAPSSRGKSNVDVGQVTNNYQYLRHQYICNN